MIYEIRIKKFMETGSESLGKYFKDKQKAEEFVNQLNQYLPNMYFINEIILVDS